MKKNIDDLQNDLSAEKGLTSSYLAKTESQSNEVRSLKLTIDEKEKYIAKLKGQLDASQSKVAMQHQEHLDRKNKIETLSSSVLSLNKKIEGNDRKVENIQQYLIDQITHRSGNLSKAYVLEVIEKSFRRDYSPAECVKVPLNSKQSK